MKVLKAKVRVDRTNGSTHYTYPWNWLKNKSKIPNILYPKDRTDEVTENGVTYQWVYPIVPDDVATELLQDPNFELADSTEMDAYATKHHPQRKMITNQDELLTLLAKSVSGQTLTQEEKDKLTEGTPTSLIKSSKSWSEICTDYNVENL